MNDKWTLYLMSSINKHFEAAITSEPDLQITLFCEGLPRTKKQMDSENLVEVRYTGPFWTMVGPTSWKVRIVINCAIQTVINDHDNFSIWRIFGKVNKAFATPIVIYAYEKGISNPTQIGCLQLRTGKDDIVDNFLGQVDPNLAKVQGEVTAQYTIDLEDNA